MTVTRDMPAASERLRMTLLMAASERDTVSIPVPMARALLAEIDAARGGRDVIGECREELTQVAVKAGKDAFDRCADAFATHYGDALLRAAAAERAVTGWQGAVWALSCALIAAEIGRVIVGGFA